MRIVVCLGFLLILLVSVGSHVHFDGHLREIPQFISSEVENFKFKGRTSHGLLEALKAYNGIKDTNLKNDLFCQTCDLVISQVIEYRRNGANKDSVQKFAKKLCNLFADWGDEVCDGYINIELDTLLYIIDNKNDLTAMRICSIYYQPKQCQDPEATKWIIPLPPVNHTLHRHRHHHHITDSKPLKILHLTDFHFDPLYEAGSNADCDLPLCCQKQNGPPKNASKAAGHWGDYNVCDIPWYTVTNFTDYLTKLNTTYDYIYYTGDIISHRSWATNKDDNTKAIKQLFDHFKATFKKTPVYPILGNHEPHPTDFYSSSTVNTSSSISTQWIFDLMADQWKTWLPNSTQETLRKGGYYTFLTKDKFRIIALNSNVAFISNFWLLYNDIDPYDQLKWLVDVLHQSEKNNEKVHILSHIPPGEPNSAQQWSNQYHRIVDRFAPIIAAQFNGHTHLDELRLFKDSKGKVVNVAYNGGSFTTFVGFNPNYRVYQVNSTDFRVLDYDHFSFNLTQANLNPNKSPEWKKLYSFKEAYGIKDTSYDSLGDMIGRMAKNKTMSLQYFKFQGRDSDVEGTCSDLCLEKVVCGITAVETIDVYKCQQLKKKKKSLSRHNHV